MPITISRLGTMVGSLAGAATYTSLMSVTTVASSAIDIALDTTGALLGRGAGLLFGFGAEAAVAATCRLLGRGATTMNTIYTPVVATAAATVVGLGAGLMITGGECVINAAVHRVQEEYKKATIKQRLAIEDEPVLIEELQPA